MAEMKSDQGRGLDQDHQQAASFQTAAQPSGTSGPQASAPDNASSHRGAKAAIGIIAAVVIAFCAWAMSAYVRGEDPLAWLDGSNALSTTQEAADGSADAAADAPAAATATLSSDDVAQAIASLTFAGDDVSVPADQVRVVLTDKGIWVEQVETDGASAMAELTARRAAALAAWAAGTGVDVPRVSWISEDVSGAVRLVISYQTADAPTTGDVTTLVPAADAYAFSGDAYAALGANPGFDQQKGELPALPNGSAISVDVQTTSQGEQLDASKEQGLTQVSGGGVLGGGSSSSGTSGNGSTAGSNAVTSGGNGGASSSSSQISVSVTVDGSNAGWGSSSAQVTLAAGSTVYDALRATGVGMNASNTAYGMYVRSIGGLAEKDHGPKSGWMYAVNGTEPNAACSNYKLSNGDRVTWSYVNVEY